MSKKLTIAEREFLVSLVSKKIAEKKTKQIAEKIEKNPAYIELQRKTQEIQVLKDQLQVQYDQVKEQLCSEFGMSGKYQDNPIILNGCQDITVKPCQFTSYDVRAAVEEKIMYSQVVLGGISEDFVEKLVNELS